MRGLPAPARCYYWTVVGLATAAITTGITTGRLTHINWTTFAVLTLLFLACESAPVPLSTQRAKVSLSFAATLAAVVLLGPTGAALVGASAIFTGQRRVSLAKRVFNGGQFALSGYTAGRVFCLLHGDRDRVGQPGWTRHAIGPFTASLATFVAVNLLLMGGILLAAHQVTIREALRDGVYLAAGCLGFGTFGLLIAAVWPILGPAAAVLVLIPLLIARWAFAQLAAEKQAHAAVIATLCQAVETKDFYTRGHSERVSHGSVMIARRLGMRAARLDAIRYAGMLHDVGKLGVPTKVLQKPGTLTEEEFAAIQLHPMRGLEIVKEIGFLDEALTGIMHHHERIDGTGYPMGLAGDEIPEFARVIAVADTFDTITSTRSYRPARTVEEAVTELRRCVGTHFDPVIVEAFLSALAAEGWPLPGPVVAPEGAEVALQDHDDVSAPIQVADSPNVVP